MPHNTCQNLQYKKKLISSPRRACHFGEHVNSKIFLSKVDPFLSKIISQVLLTDVKGKDFIVQMLVVEIVTYCLQVLEACVQSLAEARK